MTKEFLEKALKKHRKLERQYYVEEEFELGFREKLQVEAIQVLLREIEENGSKR